MLGNVSTQQVSASYSLDIDLLDISYGVDSGDSPLIPPSREGILAANNASIASSIPVSLDPTQPYLYLPNSTCAAIAQNLPLTYMPQYDLYIWNTNDSRYTDTVTSPTYFSFTFRGSATNLTIKVPFQLLKLTLDASLVGTATPYFPCQPPKPFRPYSLGRAFLQAAFIGVDWDKQPVGEWYLAQAPGPNTASQPSQVPFGGIVTSASSDWSGSWQNHWTPIAKPGRITTLSTGAIVGTVLAVFILVAGIFIGVALFCVRRRKGRRITGSFTPEQQATFLGADGTPMMVKTTPEVPQDEVFEAPSPGPTELRSGQGEHHELLGSPEDSSRSPEDSSRSTEYLSPSPEDSSRSPEESSPKSPEYLLPELQFSPVDEKTLSPQRQKPPRPPKPVSLQRKPVLGQRTERDSRGVSWMSVDEGGKKSGSK